MTYKHVNEGLKKLTEQELEGLEKQRVPGEKKRLAEKKTVSEILDWQLRVEPQRYNEAGLPPWQAAWNEIDTAWAATK